MDITDYTKEIGGAEGYLVSIMAMLNEKYLPGIYKSGEKAPFTIYLAPLAWFKQSKDADEFIKINGKALMAIYKKENYKIPNGYYLTIGYTNLSANYHSLIGDLF